MGIIEYMKKMSFIRFYLPILHIYFLVNLRVEVLFFECGKYISVDFLFGELDFSAYDNDNEGKDRKYCFD